MPGITRDGLGVVGVVDDGEAVAGETVPFRRRGPPRVDDLEVDGEVAG